MNKRTGQGRRTQMGGWRNQNRKGDRGRTANRVSRIRREEEELRGIEENGTGRIKMKKEM